MSKASTLCYLTVYILISSVTNSCPALATDDARGWQLPMGFSRDRNWTGVRIVEHDVEVNVVPPLASLLECTTCTVPPQSSMARVRPGHGERVTLRLFPLFGVLAILLGLVASCSGIHLGLTASTSTTIPPAIDENGQQPESSASPATSAEIDSTLSAGPHYSTAPIRVVDPDGWVYVLTPHFDVAASFTSDIAGSPPGEAMLRLSLTAEVGCQGGPCGLTVVGDTPGRTPPDLGVWIRATYVITDPETIRRLQSMEPFHIAANVDSIADPLVGGVIVTAYGNLANNDFENQAMSDSMSEADLDWAIEVLNAASVVLDVSISPSVDGNYSGCHGIIFRPDGTATIYTLEQDGHRQALDACVITR